MNIVKPLLIATSILLSQATFASDDKHEEGEKLFKTYCSACHGAAVGGMDMSKRIAPPIAAVRLHYIDTYPDEASFVAAVTNWVEEQKEAKSLMRGAIQKFKIMPPLVVSKEDATKIAAFIYAGDIEKPEGFEKHVEEEHGKMGMGKDMHGEGHGKEKMKGMHGEGHGKGKMKGKHGEGKGAGKMEGMHGEGMGKMHGEGKGMGKMQDMQAMMQAQGMDHQKGMQEMQKHMKKRMHKMGKEGGKHAGKKGGMRAKMMKKLDLTAEQKQQMQALIQEQESRIGPIKRELHQINKTFGQLDTTSSDYKAQIFSLADDKAKRVRRMMIEKGEMRMKIESVLTAEQREKFNKMRMKRQQRKQNKKNH
ncbi:MAG TPA: c-type cytochrome [Leucothrix sp.]|nr:c-type cytochrome [Leucothrix sp.]